MRREVKLAGIGGQGIMLAGEILGAAAALYDNLNSVQTETYGAAARGTLAYSDVIISNENIDYTRILDPDILIILEQEAYEKFGIDASSDCVIIYDSKTVEIKKEDENYYGIPFGDIAREDLGQVKVENIVLLGAAISLTGVVSKESIQRATLERVPEGTEDLNKEALEKGFSVGKKWFDKHGKEKN